MTFVRKTLFFNVYIEWLMCNQTCEWPKMLWGATNKCSRGQIHFILSCASNRNEYPFYLKKKKGKNIVSTVLNIAKSPRLQVIYSARGSMLKLLLFLQVFKLDAASFSCSSYSGGNSMYNSLAIIHIK